MNILQPPLIYTPSKNAIGLNLTIESVFLFFNLFQTTVPSKKDTEDTPQQNTFNEFTFPLC